MSAKAVETRWGTINDNVYPAEHPYQVAEDAVMMAGNIPEFLEDGDWHAAISHAVEEDHLPREKRVRAVAVYVVALAIRNGWDDCVCGRGGGLTQPADVQNAYDALWRDGQKLEAKWAEVAAK